MDSVLEKLSKDLFGFLHTMDNEAKDRSGCRKHAGLTGQSENALNDGLEELLKDDEVAVAREHPYPKSDQRCDIFIETGDSKTIWLEVKAAWKCWLASDSGEVEECYPNGYLFGSKSHTAAKDIEEKLNRLDRKDADYIALLIVGFDSSDKSITPNTTARYMLKKMNPYIR